MRADKGTKQSIRRTVGGHQASEAFLASSVPYLEVYKLSLDRYKVRKKIDADGSHIPVWFIVERLSCTCVSLQRNSRLLEFSVYEPTKDASLSRTLLSQYNNLLSTFEFITLGVAWHVYLFQRCVTKDVYFYVTPQQANLCLVQYIYFYFFFLNDLPFLHLTRAPLAYALGHTL